MARPPTNQAVDVALAGLRRQPSMLLGVVSALLLAAAGAALVGLGLRADASEEEAERTVAAVEVGSAVGELTWQLAEERALSMLSLASSDPQWRLGLHPVREATDSARRRLLTAASFPEGALPPRVESELRKDLRALDALPELRADVDAGALTPEEAFAGFSTLVRSGSETLWTLPRMVTDPEVVASTVGLALLIDHVESEARTATVLTMLVAQRREVSDEELSRIAEWRRQGADALLRLQHLLPAGSRQLREATAAPPAAAFQSLLRAAEERRLADQDRTTLATWEVADDYLGALLTVAEGVASELTARADATLSQARRDLATAVLGLVSLAALAVVLVSVGVAAAQRRRAAQRRLLEAQTELREVVRDLQLDLLADSLAQLDEIEVETRYVPAAEHARVGGDWYDAFLAGDGRVALVIGDVLGHGGEAVVAMDRIRQTLRVLAVTHPEPRQVLAAAHRLLLHFEPSGRSAATVWLGFLDPSNGRLEFSSGGHPPPLMLAPGLPALRVESEPIPPVGSAFAWRGQGGEVVLPPGTILLLYSDGVVEARSESIDVGIDRAAEVLEEERTASLGVIADRVMAARPDPGRDDAALLLARYTPRVVYLKVEAGEQPSGDEEESRR